MPTWSNMTASPLTREAFDEAMERARTEPVWRPLTRLISPRAWERLQKYRADPRFAMFSDDALCDCAVSGFDPADMKR